MKRDEQGRAVGPNGWIYRSSGRDPLRFFVPANCVVDTPYGRFSTGSFIDATDLTIYWQ